MSTSIDQAFITQYSAEVHEAFQRRGSLLRVGCRTQPIQRGNKYVFPKIGKGSASSKARHSKVPTMNAQHSSVEVSPEDRYAADYVDYFDALKTNIPERQLVANAGAWALGREADDQIINNGLKKGGADIAHGSAGMTLTKAMKIIEIFGNNDVPDDGNRFAAISPKAWTDLLQLKEFSSADYVGDDLVFKQAGSMKVRTWLGIHWIMHSGLGIAGNVRTCFAWHKTCVGHAVLGDITTDVSWENDYDAWFVKSKSSMNACQIDQTGIVQFEVSEA